MIPQDAAPPTGEMAFAVHVTLAPNWATATKYIEEQFGHLPAEVAYKITCENAGKFYGLM